MSTARAIAAVGATGTAGVSVTSRGDLAGATYGIMARTVNGAIAVESIGDVASNGRGIVGYASGSGAVSLRSTGEVTANFDGLYAQSIGGGAITIVSSGDVASAGSSGIYGRSGNTGSSAVTVTSTG